MTQILHTARFFRRKDFGAGISGLGADFLGLLDFILLIKLYF